MVSDAIVRTAVVFGGHRPQPGDRLYEEATVIGRLLTEQGYTVRSGGYAGLMEAVSKGAVLAGGRPQGIGLIGWTYESKNQYIGESNFIELANINLRGDCLLQGAELIVALPGGVGTLGEFFMAWTYLLMGFLPENSRIILYGEGWPPLFSMLPEHFAVDQHHTHLLHVCPDLNAFEKYIRKSSFNHTTEEKETTPDADRWDSRAPSWDSVLLDPESYVNLDEGYDRFDTFLAACVKNRIPPNTKLIGLDIGCGTGAALTKLANGLSSTTCLKIAGLDFSKEMLNIAMGKKEYADLILADIASHSLPANSFDLVFTRGITLARFPIETLHHVLERIAGSMKPGAIMVFDYLNRLWDDCEAATGKYRLSFPELEKIVHDSGLRITDVEGMARRTINICCTKVV